eukprot:3125136-Ditylum_brightwellii.AAC.1
MELFSYVVGHDLLYTKQGDENENDLRVREDKRKKEEEERGNKNLTLLEINVGVIQVKKRMIVMMECCAF